LEGFLKTEWDYSNLAKAYLARPQYSRDVVDALFAISGTKKMDKTCDVGAGVGHLTSHHIRAGFAVTAIEPNDEMRKLGLQNFQECQWLEGKGEDTKQAESSFKLVTFGSSFNVCDRDLALIESHRILEDGGWFVCMWNHRNLENPVQAKIESIIKSHIPTYGYGTRRENQDQIIKRSGLFRSPIHVNSEVVFGQKVEDCIEAWKSHATLARQAGNTFNDIIVSISTFLRSEFSSNDNQAIIPIPYTTNAWIAQKI
jgi:ubiquinone/menaquinone biosynthesis C-methylase UbiE